jgi:mercuric ion transport protein
MKEDPVYQTQLKAFYLSLVTLVATAVCCFTPVLVWLFAALGASAFVVYLDIVLLPLLATSVVVTLIFGVLVYRARANKLK